MYDYIIETACGRRCHTIQSGSAINETFESRGKSVECPEVFHCIEYEYDTHGINVVAGEQRCVLWRRVAQISATMAVHFTLALPAAVLGHFTGLGVRLLDRYLLLPLAVAKHLQRNRWRWGCRPLLDYLYIPSTHLLDELLLGTVADHGLHLVSRQLGAQHRLCAHCGMWTVDDEIAASVEFRTEHGFVVFRLHRYRATKAANSFSWS